MQLKPADAQLLDALLDTTDQMRPLLGEFKSVSQSLRASDIKDSATICEALESYITRFKPCYAQLSLSDQATEFYATVPTFSHPLQFLGEHTCSISTRVLGYFRPVALS